jgi:hypothetical protein
MKQPLQLLLLLPHLLLPHLLLPLLLLLLLLQVSLRSTRAAGWAGRMTSTCGGRTHCQQRSSTRQVDLRAL